MLITLDGIADGCKWLSQEWCLCTYNDMYWIVSTLIFSSIAYASCSSICSTASCFVSGSLFNVRLKVHQKFPKLRCVTQFLSTPISTLTIQQPLASGITRVSPLITFSEEFLECVVTVGSMCSLLRALSGIGAGWLLEQFLNVHLPFR